MKPMEQTRKTRAIRRQTPFASRDEIAQTLETETALLQQAHRKFPVKWPRYYLDLAQSPGVARMGRPSEAELLADPGDIADPIADQHKRPAPFIVQKHPDRVIVLAAKRCHFYCRFCFRREEPVTREAEPTREDWEHIFDFLKAKPTIEEPILSGGDPLTLDDETLFWVRDRLASIPSIKKWRIHSRAPVHFPQRITESLVKGLAESTLPLRFVTHFNSADEITSESRRIADLMHDRGIEYKNQAVLLRGVNDSTAAQTALWSGTQELGLRPHYLHHPDRTPGNAHFRVSIKEGLAIFRAFKEKDVAPAPAYVIDLPDGSGKVPVEELVFGGGVYQYRHPHGGVSTYRDFE